MRENGKFFSKGIRFIGTLSLIIILGHYLYQAQSEKYASEDPLFGSFSIENSMYTEKTHPTAFLVSINVSTSNKDLMECADKQGVNISEGCWVYCFEENKIFNAEKQDNVLNVYDNECLIGTFRYKRKSFLGFVYDESYILNWRGKDIRLRRDLQGFVYP